MRALLLASVLSWTIASPAWAQTGTEPGASVPCEHPPCDAPPGGSPTATETTPSPPSQPPPAPPPTVVVVREQAPPPAPPPEEESDGRATDILWIEGGLGWSYVDLVQFDNSNFIPAAEELSGQGFTGFVGAGIRLATILTLGAKASLSSYTNFDVGTLVADIGLRLPAPTIEPYLRVGLGYGWVGAADYQVPENSDTSVFGLVAEAGAGLDIYLDKIFAIGAGIDAAFLNLGRQRVEDCAPSCMIDTVTFDEDGDAVGLQLRAHGHASLHF